MHDGPHRNGDVDRGSAGSPLLRGRVRGVMVELTGPLGCLAGSVVLALALAVLIAAAVAGLIALAVAFWIAAALVVIGLIAALIRRWRGP